MEVILHSKTLIFFDPIPNEEFAFGKCPEQKYIPGLFYILSIKLKVFVYAVHLELAFPPSSGLILV